MKIFHYVNCKFLTWSTPYIQLINYLQDLELQNILLCQPKGSLSDASESLKKNGTKVIFYKPTFPTINFLCKGFADIILKVQPNIVHTRLSSAAHIASYWKKRLGYTLVATVDIFTDSVIKYYSNADYLVAVSHEVRNWLIMNGFSKEKIYVINNSLNVPYYFRNPEVRDKIRKSENLSGHTKVILGAGSLVEHKGFYEMLDACKMNSQHDNFYVWIAGEGPEKDKLEKYVNSTQSLKGRVKFWGFVKDIRPLLWASDLFILPSYKEPFGLILLEAMASGLPVIATAAGGPLDMVSSDTGCWLVPPKNSNEISKALGFALSDENLEEKGEACRRKALQFDVTVKGKEHLDMYKEIENQ